MSHVLVLSSGNYLLALTEPWLLTVWSQSGFGSPCAGKGCSDHGTDRTSEMFKHLRGILQSLISEFLQWKFSILSPVIQSHTINSSRKTNFVDRCSHNLAVSGITWRLSWFSYCSCAQEDLLTLLGALDFDSYIFPTYFSLKYISAGVPDYSCVHTCIRVKTLYSHLHSSQLIY